MGTCEWKLTDDNYQEYWETECEQAFTFYDGTPGENGFTYCPFCGETIEVAEMPNLDDKALESEE